MSNIPEVLGEGTYGCIHKPSLKCKNKKINYKDKVSKFMNKIKANEEMKEYKSINKVDKNQEFYTGNPIKCKLEKSPIIDSAIRKCQIFDSNKYFDDYSLLIMNDGGLDLEKFAKKMHNKSKSKETEEIMEKFWIESYRILYGLKIFSENDIIHRDLKPGNIVYNEDTNRMNFIDFGLMESKKKIIRECKKSNYPWTVWWSLPFEFEFLNKNEFMNFANKSLEQKKEYFKNLIKKISHQNNYINIFLSQITNNVNENIINLFIKNYYKTLINDIQKEKYDSFLEKSVNTIDIYGTSIAFLYVLKKTKHLIDEDFYKKLMNFFLRGCSSNLETRLEPNFILNEFEIILEQHGLLQKYNKHIDNHKILENIINIPTNIQNEIDKLDSPKLFTSNNTNTNITQTKKCKEGSELHPITNRCIKICKPGYSRNDKFKCVKNKTVKQKKIPENKPCKEGTEKNPITNRCVKICKPGYSRNDKFKCVKNKTVKQKKIPENKPCKEGTEKNPITNRCIKICKPGYSRNDKFKCVR